MSAWESCKKFYKVFRWVVLIVLLVVILLVMRKAAPPQVQSDPQAAARVEAKMHQAEQAVESGESYTLEMDEAELNSMLQDNLMLKGAEGATAQAAASAEGQPTLEEVQSNVRDVRVHIGLDKVTAYVVFDFHGKDLSLTLEGALRVVDGYLRLEPTAGALGSLPIPQVTLDNAVKRLFDSPDNREKFRVPPHISDIRIEDGQIKVFYNQ